MKVTWWAALGAIAFIVAGGLIILATYGQIVPAFWRWAVVVVLAGIVTVLIVVDKAMKPVTNSVPVDMWTIAHGFAGVVFGVWYIPLWLIITLTVLWEFFEAFVPGIGDQEVIVNRIVDVAIALSLWAIIVTIISYSSGQPFPIAPPFHSLSL